MMKQIAEIMAAMEVHDAPRLRSLMQEGVDPNAEWEGKTLGRHLVDMYLRSPAFSDCVQVMIDHGWRVGDQALQAVLTDDAAALAREIDKDPDVLQRRYSFDGAFTPMFEVSLLHICAEYNLVHTAELLLQKGLPVDLRAGVDAHGFGGQTPVFHTVNQHALACLDMLKLLLHHHADLHLTLPGLIWGKGYSWETFIPSVDPVSYAMMGLLRQFQRTEVQTYLVVDLLMRAKYGIDYIPGNVPNRYLQ